MSESKFLKNIVFQYSSSYGNSKFDRYILWKRIFNAEYQSAPETEPAEPAEPAGWTES